MEERKLKKQLKGKVLEAYMVPACIYGLGTLALTGRQEKVQIAEKGTNGQEWKTTAEDRGK